MKLGITKFGKRNARFVGLKAFGSETAAGEDKAIKKLDKEIKKEKPSKDELEKI